MKKTQKRKSISKNKNNTKKLLPLKSKKNKRNTKKRLQLKNKYNTKKLKNKFITGGGVMDAIQSLKGKIRSTVANTKSIFTLHTRDRFSFDTVNKDKFSEKVFNNKSKHNLKHKSHYQTIIYKIFDHYSNIKNIGTINSARQKISSDVNNVDKEYGIKLNQNIVSHKVGQFGRTDLYLKMTELIKLDTLKYLFNDFIDQFANPNDLTNIQFTSKTGSLIEKIKQYFNKDTSKDKDTDNNISSLKDLKEKILTEEKQSLTTLFDTYNEKDGLIYPSFFKYYSKESDNKYVLFTYISTDPSKIKNQKDLDNFKLQIYDFSDLYVYLETNVDTGTNFTKIINEKEFSEKICKLFSHFIVFMLILNKSNPEAFINKYDKSDKQDENKNSSEKNKSKKKEKSSKVSDKEKGKVNVKVKGTEKGKKKK